jgi:hypothetical protein
MASCTNTTVRFQLRRATHSQWDTANPVLLMGEPAYSTDVRQLKIGDGTNPWSALAYINVAGLPGTAGGVGTPTTLQGITYLTPSSKNGYDIVIAPTAGLVPGSAVSFYTAVTDTSSSDNDITALIVYYVYDYTPGTSIVRVSKTGSPNLVLY